jgi:DNA invertase Pin-like site-specific DNA recombinase
MRLIGYVRVSQPDEQPENQEYAIYKWAASAGHQVVDIVRDVGVSGAVPPARCRRSALYPRRIRLPIRVI